ncbi:hypothetical protein [Flavobacterium psychrophilum]|uniref:hypothetical protein n=1 Tax=Flavobacterium psychrophilum TaxID=96345 RepID=UPI0006187B57|nr:hypothetical protein [Flavobacterium psychrophilum]EKT3958351.1 hypothetical protein [Flavobacterium psychrophilum]EKT4510661.1 hypothetical protein [Flavobacterium psychrophilum]OAE90424.1 hypothetical protein SU65_11835 [Flavobacterium psychrophilum]
MKTNFRILATNWINLLGIFFITFLFVFLNSVLNFNATFSQALFGTYLLVCYYGTFFWIGFIVSLIILDLIFIINFKSKLKIMILLEWLFISMPFIYWTIKYKQWFFLVAVIAFFLTQMLRKKHIEKILIS